MTIQEKLVEMLYFAILVKGILIVMVESSFYRYIKLFSEMVLAYMIGENVIEFFMMMETQIFRR